jgi:pyruvate dehydrogenase E2 component (dihydrolipoamide acetyltransferase)
VERDLRAHLEAHHYGDLRVTPAARQLARLERVDILDVRGTGEGGRITVRDVERAVAERPRPLSRMRQTIAQRLVHSVTTAPHFFVTVEVDMSALWAVRKELRERGGVQYSVTDYVLMAVVRALREHPVVNSVTDGRTFTLRSAVHLGMATSIEDGLVVPVIRDAGGLTLAELHDAAAALAARAREGKLKPDAMSGSTFTVSNMGMLSVENFTAIINPGESAILAVSSTLDKPVVRQGRVEVRPIMKITLSADHRLVDGALAAAFVNTVRQTLEDETLWRSMTLS